MFLLVLTLSRQCGECRDRVLDSRSQGVGQYQSRRGLEVGKEKGETESSRLWFSFHCDPTSARPCFQAHRVSLVATVLR